MCGIAGILLRGRDSGEDDDRRVRAALARQRHRGPDDEGTCVSSGVVLGHRRLSILDLSPAGHQPMRSADGRYVCTFNGEIYNYLELREDLEARGHRFRSGSDTEVMLAAFAEHGAAAVERFRGQFAIAVWDTLERRLLLARDRVGEKPLHYWRDGERFAFASEIKALLELLPSTPALSADSVNTYLHYQFVIEPETMLEGVHKLPAGTILEIDDRQWDGAPRRYWSLSAVPPLAGDPVERMRHALDEALTLTLRSDAPVGVALSGGLDSAVIAAMAAKRRGDLTAFTVGYPGSRDYDERAPARDLAASLGIRWQSAELPTSDFAAFFPTLVQLLDEPIADVAAYGHYSVAKLAADHGVKVLLTGIGGDELFFGYAWVRRAVELSRAKLAAVAAGSPLTAQRARLLAALMRNRRLMAVLLNHRFPEGWRTFVDRQFDAARLDLDHPDEWVFYQLDYHWEPARAFTSAALSPAFAASIGSRGAYRLMQGLSKTTIVAPELAVTRMLFDSWLVSNCLDLGDRVSMGSSVETRVPLLEVGVIETALGLWAAGRREDAQGHKTWLKAIAADLLPSAFINRRKLGFTTPTAEWTGSVNSRYGSLVYDGALRQAGIVDPDRLRLWEQRTPAGIQREFLRYKLTLLELWCRLVPGGSRPDQLHGSA